MALLAYGTLSKACERARRRPGKTIAAILSLDGWRYYVFFSQPNLGQLMNLMAVQKVNVAMDIEHFQMNIESIWRDDSLSLEFKIRSRANPNTVITGRAEQSGRTFFRGRAEDMQISFTSHYPQWSNIELNRNEMLPSGRYTVSFSKVTRLLPSIVRAAHGFPPTHDVRRHRAAQLTPYLTREAKNRGIIQQEGHAEMFMIASWRECVLDFRRKTGKAPRKCTVFLTHSPCRPNDQNPSPEFWVDGHQYPVSCRAKLYTFFKKNKSVQWKILYGLRFGTGEALTDEALARDFPGISIARMPNDISKIF